jgi:hypothetical protein
MRVREPAPARVNFHRPSPSLSPSKDLILSKKAKLAIFWNEKSVDTKGVIFRLSFLLENQV